MTELLENMKRFIAAGDENRYYILNRDEVRLIIKAVQALPGDAPAL